MNLLLRSLVNTTKTINGDITFTLIEVGAARYVKSKEPFYELLDYFPSSEIIGFEVNPDTCDRMNKTARNGVKYYPHALGKTNGEKQFYVTNHPACSSLYKPNDALISLYNNMQLAQLKHQTRIETITLDTFIDTYDVGTVDFIKIDIQGAELDVFKGGKNALKHVIKIVSEVEFVPHYENQPLFGDVCAFLNKHDLMFNKFLELEGRSLKPMIIDNNINAPSQHLWSDAIFIHHVQKIPDLNDEKLLKLSFLSAVYNSPDLAFYCLSHFDQRNGTTFAQDWLTKLKS